MISFRVPITTSPPKQSPLPRSVLDYSRTDWMGLTLYLLDYDFSPLYSIADLNLLWAHMKWILMDSVHLFTPLIKVKPSRDPKWFTPEVRHHRNHVRTLRRSNRKEPSPSITHKLEQAESLL